MRYTRVLHWLCLFLLVVSCLPAADEAHGEHAFDWNGFFGWVLNSTLLFGGLILLLRKPLVRFLSERSLGVAEDIRQREKDLSQAGDEFEEIRSRLNRIEEEVERIQSTARQEGEAEMRRIETLGEEESRRILSVTESEIANRIESSLAHLKERIADLTIEHFKRGIGGELKEPDHRRIIDRNIEISEKILKEDRTSERDSRNS